MKRHIYFRAKRLDNDEWVYGQYYHNYQVTGEGITNQHFIMERTKHHETKPRQINPKTLGQYIGMKDEDMRVIYEDDIVGFVKTHNKEPYIGLVKYCPEVAGFMLTSKEAWCATEFGAGTVNLEVIGNTHDNPELLETEDD